MGDTAEIIFYLTIASSSAYLFIILFVKLMRLRSWSIVKGDVLSLTLDSEIESHYLHGGKDKNVRKINISYIYSTKEGTFTGHKVSVIDDIPIINSFEDSLYASLKRAKTNNDTIEILVNPRNNNRSILIKKAPLTIFLSLISVSIVFYVLAFFTCIKYNCELSGGLYAVPLMGVLYFSVSERILFYKNISKKVKKIHRHPS